MGIGFIAAFAMAVFVVRHVLDYIGRNGFAVFAWWRIIVGAIGLVALSMGY
jgi:undecaprenyl-diphosphatase